LLCGCLAGLPQLRTMEPGKGTSMNSVTTESVGDPSSLIPSSSAASGRPTREDNRYLLVAKDHAAHSVRTTNACAEGCLRPSDTQSYLGRRSHASWDASRICLSCQIRPDQVASASGETSSSPRQAVQPGSGRTRWMEAIRRPSRMTRCSPTSSRSHPTPGRAVQGRWVHRVRAVCSRQRLGCCVDGVLPPSRVVRVLLVLLGVGGRMVWLRPVGGRNPEASIP